MYDWATFRTTTGANTLRVLLDLARHLSSFALLATGNVHDVTPAKTLKFPPGTLTVDGRG